MAGKMNQDISIGENLKILRERSGFSQSDVAVKLQVMGFEGIQRETISQMERGVHGICVSILLALKEIYQLSNFDAFFANLDLEAFLTGK